jgi:hypothetical protein
MTHLGGPVRILGGHFRFVAIQAFEQLFGNVAFVGKPAAELLRVVNMGVDKPR